MVYLQKIKSAANLFAAAELFSDIRSNDFLHLRESVAQNRSNPTETLSATALNWDWLVRRSVAGRLSTAPEVLGLLARDENASVRLEAVQNRATPEEALKRALSDVDEWVRLSAKANLYTILRLKAVHEGYASSEYEIPDSWIESIYL